MKQPPTPGPWRVNPRSPLQVLADDGPTAELIVARASTANGHGEANARLIAQVSELLAVCQNVARGEHHPTCPIATGEGQRTITRDDCDCQVRAACAAIAKVKP